MASSLNRSQQVLIGIAMLTAVLWAVPGLYWLTLPLIYLNTAIHELCHAVAAVGTGGQVHEIAIHASGNGATLSSGGFGLAISFAGYVGAALVGSLMVALGGAPKTAKGVLAGLAIALSLGMLLWVRSDWVGISAVVLWIGVLGLGATRLKAQWALFLTQFLGVQQCVTSVMGLYVLLQINVRPGIENDAQIAERMTGVPGIVWALMWVGLSALGLWAGFRRAWGSSRRAG